MLNRKEYHRIYMRSWREKNIEKSRFWGNRTKQRNPEAAQKRREKWIQANKHKRAAHIQLQIAIRKGLLIRPSKCSECGCHCKPHGHHPDYSRPLEVIWVCQICHEKMHQHRRLDA